MTTISLADLITPPTSGEVAADQLDLLTLASFPTTSWQSGSVPLTLTQADAVPLADLGQTISKIAKGGYLTLAPQLSATNGRSPWVDLYAYNNYGKTRQNPDGIATQGTMTLTDATSAGPFTISEWQLVAQSPNGVQFQNFTGGILPTGGTLDLTWQASVAGSTGNLAAGTTWTMLTPLPGVTLTNPDPVWITQQGVDAETDASLVIRCQAMWPTLGTGATIDVYKGWAREATDGVTRALPLENTPTGGQVTIYLGSSAGPASTAQVAAVQSFINARRPLCVTVLCYPSVANAVTIAGTVYVGSAYLAAAQAAFTTALTAYASALDIGSTVYWSSVVDLIQSIMGVRNVASLTLNGSATDVIQASNAVAVFTNSLTWTAI